MQTLFQQQLHSQYECRARKIFFSPFSHSLDEAKLRMNGAIERDASRKSRKNE